MFIRCGGCVFSGAAVGPQLNNNQLYKFSYSTEVLVDRAQGSKEGSAGYKISSDVDVNLVWRDPSNKDEQLIQLKVVSLPFVFPIKKRKTKIGTHDIIPGFMMHIFEYEHNCNPIPSTYARSPM